MTQVDVIQTLWVAIETRDKAIAEVNADIQKSYDVGNTNVDASRQKRSLLRAELNALHEVLTTVQGCESRMQVVDVFYGLPWDHDEFRFQGRVVTGIEESRESGYFLLYLEVTDECKVTGNTWLNRRPIPPRKPPVQLKLTRREREALECASRNTEVYSSGVTHDNRIYWRTFDALIAQGMLKPIESIYYHRRAAQITDAGRKALEGAQ